MGTLHVESHSKPGINLTGGPDSPFNSIGMEGCTSITGALCSALVISQGSCSCQASAAPPVSLVWCPIAHLGALGAVRLRKRNSNWNVRVCPARVSQHIRDCQLPAAYLVGVAGSSPGESRSSASIPLLNLSPQHITAKMRSYTPIFTLALSLGLAQADSGCTVTMTPSISDAQDPPDTITYGELPMTGHCVFF